MSVCAIDTRSAVWTTPGELGVRSGAGEQPLTRVPVGRSEHTVCSSAEAKLNSMQTSVPIGSVDGQHQVSTGINQPAAAYAGGPHATPVTRTVPREAFTSARALTQVNWGDDSHHLNSARGIRS